MGSGVKRGLRARRPSAVVFASREVVESGQSAPKECPQACGWFPSRRAQTGRLRERRRHVAEEKLDQRGGVAAEGVQPGPFTEPAVRPGGIVSRSRRSGARVGTAGRGARGLTYNVDVSGQGSA